MKKRRGRGRGRTRRGGGSRRTAEAGEGRGREKPAEGGREGGRGKDDTIEAQLAVCIWGKRPCRRGGHPEQLEQQDSVGECVVTQYGFFAKVVGLSDGHVL
jgi:hypothetical protein